LHLILVATDHRCIERANKALSTLRFFRFTLFISGDGMGRRITAKPVVLIVEDEAIIRMNIVQVARDAGYEVLEASNADEAVDILECRDDICAVFTDVRMPGYMDGIRLAHVIRGRWPPIQLIIMSGLEAPDDSDFPWFIRKPYGNEQITAALREVQNVQ
jgi:two-component system, response regulator PdtaR